MRWIFFALVFANLLLLALFWQQQTLPEKTAGAVLNISDSSKQLTLLNELEQPPLAVNKAAQAATGANKRQPNCYAAGPYADELDARHLLARASGLGFSGDINPVDVETDTPAEYWVHVPPRATRAEALRILKELQQRKFDSYIITQGDLAEGVSLGLFRNQNSAVGLQKKVEAFDIPVEIFTVNQSRREYWVQLREVTQLTEQMRARILGQDQNISWQLAACLR